MKGVDIKYYEKQDYLLFVIGSLLFNEYHSTIDTRIKESINRVISALAIGDVRDENTFKYVFNELMVLGVNSKSLEWDVSSMIIWCKDFNKNKHYPITYGDKVNGKDVNVEGVVDGIQFWSFLNSIVENFMKDNKEISCT